MPWPPLLNSASSRPARDLHGLTPARRRWPHRHGRSGHCQSRRQPRGHVLWLAAGGYHAPTPVPQRVGRRQSDARRTPGDENAARQMGFPVLRPQNTPSSQAQGNPRTCSPTGRFRHAQMRPAVADPLDQLHLRAERQRRENGVTGRRPGAEVDAVARDAQARAFRGWKLRRNLRSRLQSLFRRFRWRVAILGQHRFDRARRLGRRRFTCASAAVSAEGSITWSICRSSPVHVTQGQAPVRVLEQRIVRTVRWRAGHRRRAVSASLSPSVSSGAARSWRPRSRRRGSASVGSCLWPAPWSVPVALAVSTRAHRDSTRWGFPVSPEQCHPMSACWQAWPLVSQLLV
jgi:hypothetical protein